MRSRRPRRAGRSPARRQIRNAAGVRTSSASSPQLIPDYLALVGDARTAIPGIAGIGRRRRKSHYTHGRIEDFPAEVSRRPARSRAVVQEARHVAHRAPTSSAGLTICAFAAPRATLRPSRSPWATAAWQSALPPPVPAEAQSVRTYVRGPRRRSCTPTSMRSTRRSSSATIRRCADSPVIVGGGVVLAASYEAKALRRPHRHGRPPAPAALPARDRRCGPACRPTPRPARRSSRCSTTPPAGRGPLHRRGVPGRARHGAHRRHAGRDRRAAARPGARAGRAADHRRRRAHQVPGEGRQRRRQARRAAGGAARR